MYLRSFPVNDENSYYFSPAPFSSNLTLDATCKWKSM